MHRTGNPVNTLQVTAEAEKCFFPLPPFPEKCRSGKGLVLLVRAAPARDAPGGLAAGGERGAGPAADGAPRHGGSRRSQGNVSTDRAQAANIHSQLPAEALATEDAPKTLASLHCRLTGHTTVATATHNPKELGIFVPQWHTSATGQMELLWL